MKCQYCGNEFSSKTNLNSHQKRVKYCLKLRGKSIENVYKCDGCGKMFSRQYHLTRHQQICNSRIRGNGLENVISRLTRERMSLNLNSRKKKDKQET